MERKQITPLALVAIRKNTTKRGIIAASGVNKDYLHVWPRDALLVVLELKNFSSKIAEKILENILALPTDKGLFYQRYELNGRPDPDAWCDCDGSRQLDQDALRFVAVSKFSSLRLDLEKLRESYTALLNQVKEKKPSTDVWEQKKGYFFYTTAALIWGFKCAEKVIPESKNLHKSVLKELIGSIDSFYDEGLKSFVKNPSEKIIDLEVALGLNILFESGLGLFNTKEKLMRVQSTLEAIEKELCVTVGKSKIPIRYKNDFWNGECVGSNGSGRPWPMGAAIISQTYAHLTDAALKIGEYKIAGEALKNASKWVEYMRQIPNIHDFPEQINYDGSLPRFVPRPLAWCAAEIIKAERMYADITNKVSFYPTANFLSRLYKPKLTLNFVLN